MASDLRIALVGFGHVGRRFAELLLGPYRGAFHAQGLRPLVTGIATARHGLAIDPAGLPLRRCLDLVASGGSLAALSRRSEVRSVEELIRCVRADVLLEVTPLDPRGGEPALSHVREALRRGLDVVTANKGPVAFGLRDLRALARRRRRRFLFEGAVMDGVPVFNMVERCLPGARILGFRGTLNSTTNHIFSRMEEGASPPAALREAQALGIAEADPSNDLEGWDSAVKGCALANALMDASVRPERVRRRGALSVTAAEVRGALRSLQRIRLVTRGDRRGGRVRVSVGPERLAFGDPLSLSGPDATLVLETDVMGEIGVLERGASLDQTAYALFTDLVAVAHSRRR
jgi:homoserine dehydrogenase